VLGREAEEYRDARGAGCGQVVATCASSIRCAVTGYCPSKANLADDQAPDLLFEELS